MGRVWQAEISGSIWGTTTEGALFTIRPGIYSLKEGEAGTYVIDLADDRVWIESARIEEYRRQGALKIQGEWP